MFCTHTNAHTLHLSLACVGWVLTLLLAAQPLAAVAQVTGVGLPDGAGGVQPVLSGLGAAVGTGAIEGVTETFVGTGEEAIDGVTSGIQTGNVITDAALESVSGVLGSYLSCKLAGFASSVGGQLQSALPGGGGRSVPTADATVALNTGAVKGKECFVDGLAFELKEALIKGLIAGLTEYVNNGFNGSPAYVQDYQGYLAGQREQVFEDYLNNPDNFSVVCSAWSADLRLALATDYTTSTGGRRVTQLSGTGTGVSNGLSSGPETCPLDNGGFFDGENTDYWGEFLTRTTQTQGNAVTSYFDLEQTLQDNISARVEEKIDELQRNKGFFDVTYCDDGSDYYRSLPGDVNTVGGQSCKVTTPGSVIEEQLNLALGSDIRRLEVADELNELFSALVGALLDQVFSSGGLFGASQRNGASESLLEQYAGESNPAVVSGSRDQLLEMLSNYQTGIEQFITIKEQMLSALFQAREAIFDVRACYESKYNTWIHLPTQTIIPPDEVVQIALEERERAIFLYYETIRLGTTSEGEEDLRTLTYRLEGETAGDKVDYYAVALEEMNDYIVQTQREIDHANLQRDEARLLSIQLGTVNQANDPLSAALASSSIVTLIAEKFGEADTSSLNMVDITLEDGTTVSIPQDLNAQQLLEVFAIASEELALFDNLAAENQLRLTEIAVTDLVEGTPEIVGGPRFGGLDQDLEQCRRYSTIEQLISEDDSTEGNDNN